jgi:hypothetical protein
MATSYAPPERHDVFSKNHAFVLDVNPQTQVHTIYATETRDKPLWTFSEPVGHAPILLSDDGTVVATIAWKHIKEENIPVAAGVQFWNKDGLFRSYSLRELCSNPPRTQDVGLGPVGEFWHTWYREATDGGDRFWLRTTTGSVFEFRFADGELINHRPVALNSVRRYWWLVAAASAVVVPSLAFWLRRRKTKDAGDTISRRDPSSLA